MALKRFVSRELERQSYLYQSLLLLLLYRHVFPSSDPFAASPYVSLLLKELSKPGHSGDSSRQNEARVGIYKLFQNKLVQRGTRQMSLDLRGHPIMSHHLRDDDHPSCKQYFKTTWKIDRAGNYYI